jgi:hypothetical protein
MIPLAIFVIKKNNAQEGFEFVRLSCIDKDKYINYTATAYREIEIFLSVISNITLYVSING